MATDSNTAGTEKKSIERSTIEFPYLDEHNAFEIAEGVHKVGGSSCDWDQLAAHFNQAAQGGGFRMRLISAKTFGLVLYDRGRINLTSLGMRAVDPMQQKGAKVEAFLSVPLYKAVYERFRGGKLPPSQGLEHEMVVLGVAKKQADKARQAFQRSAKFAGFFDFGADRLVAPSLNGSSGSAPSTPDPSSVEDRPAPVGAPQNNELHPFIVGLLRKLPEPDSPWSMRERAKWLETAANIFDLMYAPASDGTITVKFDRKSGEDLA